MYAAHTITGIDMQGEPSSAQPNPSTRENRTTPPPNDARSDNQFTASLRTHKPEHSLNNSLVSLPLASRPPEAITGQIQHQIKNKNLDTFSHLLRRI